MKKKPAIAYIRRGVELVSLQTRIDADLKEEVDMAAKELDTSLNRFVEAAIQWFIQELRKEGEL